MFIQCLSDLTMTRQPLLVKGLCHELYRYHLRMYVDHALLETDLALEIRARDGSSQPAATTPDANSPASSPPLGVRPLLPPRPKVAALQVHLQHGSSSTPSSTPSPPP